MKVSRFCTADYCLLVDGLSVIGALLSTLNNSMSPWAQRVQAATREKIIRSLTIELAFKSSMADKRMLAL